MVAPVISRQGRQLARTAREIATTALIIEKAAERGDFETVHTSHEALLVLHREYRLAYRRLLATR